MILTNAPNFANPVVSVCIILHAPTNLTAQQESGQDNETAQDHQLVHSQIA
jgi:hypothetical protein